MDQRKITLKIILWYGFTIVSTICSKKYLNFTNDTHTLTLVTFAIPLVVKLFTRGEKLNLLKNIKSNEYFFLALFNIGTTLLTNIGMNETTVSLTYMVKASEPLFVLLLSYFILQKRLMLIVHLTLIPICVGVVLIVFGDVDFDSIGFFCAFAANLSSASRNVFYKSKLNEQSSLPFNTPNFAFQLDTYLNVGFVSFFLYLPVYLIRSFVCFVLVNSDNTFLTVFASNRYIPFDQNTIVMYLILGSFFNFLYNLASFCILSNITPITHSIINIMKRVFIVFSSLIIFTTKISSVQMTGMLMADAGVVAYTYLKLKRKEIDVTVLEQTKKTFKKVIIYVTVLILLFASFYNVNKFESKKNNEKRIVCLNKIKNQIKESFASYLSEKESVHLLDLPLHDNYGDTLIWLGEEKFIEEFNLNVKNRIPSSKDLFTNKTELEKLIKQDETILLHGGGNFGDLWREYNDYRNSIVSSLSNNKIIIFPQTINYQNQSLVPYDYGFLKQNKKLTIMVRSFESENFAKESFPEINSLYVPDMAFMLGNQVPIRKNTHDILVLRRIDKEANVDKKKWEEALEEVVKGKFTYLVKDWMDYKDLPHNNMMELIQTRLILVNQIISQGRVIICDRLHASIISLLMGKPHIMINEKFNKVINTRESAFDGKPECNQKYIRGFYAQNVNEAVSMAKYLLENNLI